MKVISIQIRERRQGKTNLFVGIVVGRLNYGGLQDEGSLPCIRLAQVEPARPELIVGLSAAQFFGPAPQIVRNVSGGEVGKGLEG